MQRRCTEARLCLLFNSRCNNSCDTLLSGTTTITAVRVKAVLLAQDSFYSGWEFPDKPEVLKGLHFGFLGFFFLNQDSYKIHFMNVETEVSNSGELNVFKVRRCFMLLMGS